jgi:peptidoglycan/xylan/chitin deacetylase (PgdA/CDA1 family)
MADIPPHGVILQYHHVSETTPFTTSISPDQFKLHLQWLEENDFRILPLSEIIKRLNSREPLADKTAAITFDDGYSNVYENAYPLLKKRGWPFTIFVNTGPVDQEYKSHINWGQIKEMMANGANIANHSITHPFMLRRKENETKQQWLQRLRHEVVYAETRIREQTGKSEKLFAYPYGESSEEIKNLLEELGYIAFGQHSGPIGYHSDFLNLPRFAFAGNYSDIKSFADKMLSLPMSIVKVSAQGNSQDGFVPFDVSTPQLHLTFSHPVKAAQLNCFASGQGRINVRQSGANSVEIIPNKSIPVGRSRFNCTSLLPSTGATGPNRYHWYSYQWVRLGEGNQWRHE